MWWPPDVGRSVRRYKGLPHQEAAEKRHFYWRKLWLEMNHMLIVVGPDDERYQFQLAIMSQATIWSMKKDAQLQRWGANSYDATIVTSILL